ncbi:DEAD/DEAH box helicase [Alteromonas ponticola]|uniref:DEAD/DEAH box helicase n=1 Tax=Alteromonas aquimaris TaxID=2998417 RepID=A0ABT3P6V2_9ALTE|nr:DEAD/DEAH box helicase [Alteromonas aquimaris]MCW8108497.1 DEAD/DEAH box helicase [Alteromonas aquimaris]
MQISDLPVHHKIVSRLVEKGFQELTEIQQKTILPALKGQDIIASSKTGSGKTLAFLIPTVHRLLSQKALSKQDPRVLILAPTRELAKQVFGEVKTLTSSLGLKSVLVLGGENFNDQAKQLRKNPHIIVGTAGRIADHLRDKAFFLNGLELLILDEADRMLDLGFADALIQINEQADHRKRQTLMFSATADSVAMTSLSKQLLKSPVRIAVGDAGAEHGDIQQQLYFADHIEHKDELLQLCIDNETFNQAIIFTATREDTSRLTELLNQKQRFAVSLSGELAQSKRANIMSEFARGKHSILVTTDVASRGLDLPKVGLVINFDLPKHADEYIHRIGRTGRAGNKGNAISLVGPRDWSSFLEIKQNVSYSLNCVPHADSPAKFTGKKIKKNKTDNSEAGKHVTPTAPDEGKTTKRVKTMSGEDAGHMPVKRKRVQSNFKDD